MNNTEKLLRAFIEASGYEAEETPIIFKSVTDGSVVQTGIDYKVTKKVDQSKEDLIIEMCQEIFKHSGKIKNNVTEIKLDGLCITFDKVTGELLIGGYNESI